MRYLVTFLIFFAFCSLLQAQVDVTATAGTASATYATVKEAFDAVNLGTHQGEITLTLTNNTTETASAVLNASGGSSSYTNLYIYTSGTYSISGSIAGALIDLNGADNVVIDGRVGQTGSTKSLTIDNTNTGGWAIRFIEDATTNTVKYTIVKGSNNTGNITSSAPSAGVILFSTSTTGTVGNDNNLIDYCDIDCRATAKAGVVSVGSSGKTNSGITISNSNIYDFYISSASTASTAGIVFGSQTASCTASGNSLYQTASRQYVGGTSVTHYGIIVNNANGSYDITGNYIGGSEALCGGTAWTTTQTNTTANGYRFWAIDLESSVTGTSSIQGNTIKNFNISTNFSTSGSGGVYAIVVQGGSANIGNVTGNVIGATTGTGNITVNCNAATGGGGLVAGITVTSTGVYNISNNTIGSVLTSATTSTVFWNLYGIHSSGVHTGLTISNNTIGSTSTANSFENSAGSGMTSTSQYNTMCIRVASGASTAAASITNNTIANITMGGSTSTNPKPVLNGIFTSGTNIATVTGNTIRDMKNAGGNISTGSTIAIAGVLFSSTGSGQTISGNTIYNLEATHGSGTTIVGGLYYAGGTSGTNTVSKNKIYNLSLSTSSTAQTVPAIYGIMSNAGTTTYSNNIISLGYKPDGSSITTGYPMASVYEPLGTDNFYYNSLYMGGTDVVSSGSTYAMQSQQTSNTRNFKNNIFYNARSNASGSGKNYAIRYGGSTVNPTGLTSNNNLYYAGGTGAVFGYFNLADRADMTAWRAALGQDAQSYAAALTFSSTTTLKIDSTSADCWAVNGKGIAITGQADDFTQSSVRSTSVSGGTTDIGADEFTPSGAGVTPGDCTTSGSIADGGTTNINFADRTIATLTWHQNSGTLPTAVSVKYFSGETPAGASATFGSGYWRLQTSDGSGNWKADLTLNYDDGALGNISTEANVIIYREALALTSTGLNTTTNNITTSNLTITAGEVYNFAIGQSDAAFPVELTTFTVRAIDGKAKLQWATATEQNSSMFIVERAITNGTDKNWTVIGQVQASGNSNVVREYAFVDATVAAGKYSYRLKMVDNDGSFEYSKTIEFEGVLPKEFRLGQNYPNPFNPSTTIEFMLPADAQVSLELFAISGEKIASVVERNFSAGTHTVSVNMNRFGLSSGVYFYRMTATGVNGVKFVNTRTMIVLK